MKAVTTCKRNKNIFILAQMTVFVMLMQPALHSQIIYTDIVPDTILCGSSSSPFHYYHMDLNHDSVDDIRFAHFAPSASWLNAEVYSVWGNNQDEEILTSGGYPMALNLGTSINQSSGTWVNTVSGSTNSALFLNANGSGGYWLGVTNKYIGLRFQVAGQWYYGWARLDVPSTPVNMTIKDYAVQTTANTPINAGDNGTVSVNEIGKFNISVYSYLKDIYISSFADDTKKAIAKVFTITGEEVYSSVIGGNAVIKMDGNSRGIYVVRIFSDDHIQNYKVLLK